MIEVAVIARIASYLSAGISIGLGAIGPAIGVGITGGAGVRASARQPVQSGALLKNMLIGQAVSETPGIFALVLALIFVYTDAEAATEGYSIYAAYAVGAAFIGGALAMGLSALGSGAGNGLVASESINSISINPRESGQSMITMFIGQALGQTPVIFGLLVAIFLKYKIGLNDDFEEITGWAGAFPVIGRVIGAGIAMGAGAIGPALGISIVGQSASKVIARRIENRSLVMRTMFIGAAVAESTSIYSFVVALLLLFN